MLTGVLGLVFSYRAQHEQEVVKFAAYPSAGLTDLSGGGLGVRVQLVNQSLRPVIVRSASLWQGTTRLANASGYLRDARVLDRADVDTTLALTSGLADLPLNLGAREGRAAAFLLNVWSGVSDSPGAAARVARDNLTATLNALDPTSSPKRPLILELDLAPGGARRFVLKGLRPSTTAQATEEATSAQPADWLLSPLGSPPKLIGLLLRHPSGGVGEVDLVRLDVWKQDSSLHRSIMRPVLGQQATIFPLNDLARGAYEVTFELGSRVIANRSFSVPWRREPCAVGLEEAVASDGSTSPAWC